MKNIFKKNSIIITALAIMIVIAGYLSFTNRDAAKDADKVAKTSTSDVLNDDTAQVDSSDVINDTDTTADKKKDTDKKKESKVTTAPKDKTSSKNKTKDVSDSDISDDDILSKSSEVSDNGELNLEDGTPGEAVLANKTLDASYFSTAKMKREQVRAKNKETYLGVIESADASEKSKEKATNSLIQLTQVMEKEEATEILLGAKGFEDAIVFIVDDKVDVVVNSASLSDQQLAIIEDVVKDKTDISVDNIDIIPVVVSE